jgi:hypothetical protein
VPVTPTGKKRHRLAGELARRVFGIHSLLSRGVQARWLNGVAMNMSPKMN